MTIYKSNDPSLTRYGLIAWISANFEEMVENYKRLRKEGKSVLAAARTAWFSGYCDLTQNPPHVHILTISWLKWLPTYAKLLTRQEAHEHRHAARGDAWHSDDEQDVMGRTFGDNLGALDQMRDSDGAIPGSAAWRSKVSTLSKYDGARPE